MRRPITAVVCALALGLPASASAATDPLRGGQWNLSMVESDAAHAASVGSGAKVAIIDTGIKADHPDLQGARFLQGHDFVGQGDATPQDGNGHGTHVAGIVGANEGNGVGVASVAPAAAILPVRVLDDDGGGFVQDVVEGIDYAVAQGADVINLSLGPEVPLVGSAGFDAAIDRALDAGRVVVAASGNEGLPACSQPSGQGRLLCVGSVDKRRGRSFFSNFGSGLGVVAPGGSGLSITLRGEDILSTYTDADGYEEIAGTSQAAPHVAGVAALLASKGLRGQAAVRRILATASDAGPSGPDATYGAGIVNARAAVQGLPAVSTGGAAPGAGAGARTRERARIALRRRDRIRRVLRRGIRVRCRATGRGRCRVAASHRGRRVAGGAARVRDGRSIVAVARLNRRGRALLRRALRRRRAVVLRVRVTLPGARPQIRRLRLMPDPRRSSRRRR